MRTTSPRARVRFIQDPIRYVNVATLIPDGMHGIEPGYHREGWRSATLIPDGMHAHPVVDRTSFATEPVIANLIVNGMDETSARSLVHGAAARVRSGSGLSATQMVDKTGAMDSVFQDLLARGIPDDRARILVRRASARYHSPGGLGQDATDPSAPAPVPDPSTVPAAPDPAVTLATVQAAAKSTEATHQSMIANMAAWDTREPGWITTDDNLRLTFQDQLTALMNQFVTQMLPVLGVQFPYQIDRTDPAGAVVLAVRDDIQNTIDLLDARKEQQVLQKQIADLTAIPIPSAPPTIVLPGNVPWYVWAGGALVGAGMVYKTFIK
jgi:hypothetical protein